MERLCRRHLRLGAAQHPGLLTPRRAGADACLLAILSMQHTPIAPAPPSTAARLATLATRIQSTKQSNPTADTQPLEHEIDKTVYTLYTLDERDIALIEGTVHR